MLVLSGCTWLNAPLLRRGIFSSQPSRFCSCKLPMASISCRIAVVGDVHDDWNLEADTKALQLLKPDLVLFTGDFGNENVDLVESISNVDFTKAVILGNHDAWNTQKFSPRYSTHICCDWQECFALLYGATREKDAVQQQLDFLGDEHVGYRRMDFPNLKLSIVGGRPFSCGGQHLYRKKLLTARYGIHDMDGSAKRIYQASLGTPADHSVIFLAHNGPTGLGSNVDDICGRDWIPGGGDHGDPDLARAISQLKETTKLSIKLVVFGHMHKELASGNGLRKMIVVGEDNIAYLNGAIVPRVKKIRKEEGVTSENEGTLRAFTVVDTSDGSLEKIVETWVSVIGDEVRVEEELVLLSKGARL